MTAILAIETSSHACSVAILQAENNQQTTLHQVYQVAAKQHTDLLHPMLDEVLQQANLSLVDINALAYGCGPGAFTGVRIATSVIKAMAYAIDKPVIAVSSLACLAQAVVREQSLERILVINDARMKEVYLACYLFNNGALQLIGQEKLLKPELIEQEVKAFCQAGKWFGIGTAWDEYHALLEKYSTSTNCLAVDSSKLPMAQDIAILAMEKYRLGDLETAQSAMPVYLRDSIV